MSNKIINKNVINDLNLLGPNAIGASAGTGKTYTITGLVIRLLLGDFITCNFASDKIPDPLNIEDILVITFTNAATSDLKRKIRERICEVRKKLVDYYCNAEFFAKKDEFLQLENDALIKSLLTRKLNTPESLSEGIRRLKLAEKNIDLSAISTIHKFCHTLLHKFVTSTMVSSNGTLVTSTTDLDKEALYRAKAYFYYDDALTKEEADYLANFKVESLDNDNLKLKIANADNYQHVTTIKEHGKVKILTTIHEIFTLIDKVKDSLFKNPKLNALIDNYFTLLNKDGILVKELKPTIDYQNTFPETVSYISLNGSQILSNNPLEMQELSSVFKKEYIDFIINFEAEAISQTLKNLGTSTIEEKSLKPIKAGDFYLLTKIINGRKKNAKAIKDELLGSNIIKDGFKIFLDTLEDFGVANIGKNFKDNAITDLILTKAMAITEELKSEQDIITTDDLLFKLKYVIERYEDVREQMQNQVLSLYPVAIIDEFQDTDPVQFAVFKNIYLDSFKKHGLESLKQEGKLQGFYVVGDRKQSIYAFRDAELNCYLQAVNLIRSFAEDRVHILDTNYRSNANLVEGVNSLFHKEQIISNYVDNLESKNDLGNIFDSLEFTDSKAAKFKNKCYLCDDIDFLEELQSKGHLPLSALPNTMSSLSPCQLLDIKFDKVTDIKDFKIARELQTCASLCSQKILELIRFGIIVDKDTANQDIIRPVTVDDIAILVADVNQYKVLSANLALFNIPSAYQSERATIDSTEEFASLKKLMAAVLDNKDQQALRSLLLSKFFSISASLYEELSSGANYERLLATLAHAKELWYKSGFLAMFEYFTFESGVVFKDKSVKSHILSFEGGRRVLANLMHSAELALYLSAQVSDPESLIPLFEKIQAPENLDVLNGDDELLAKMRLSDDKNVVKVTTYHGSKGLEYPIVFLPFIGNLHTAEDIMARAKFGIVSCYDANLESKVYDLTGSKDVLAKAKEEKKLEQARLFYVAATRAATLMYLFSVNLPNDTENFYDVTKRSPLKTADVVIRCNPSFYQKLTRAFFGRNREHIANGEVYDFLNPKEFNVEENLESTIKSYVRKDNKLPLYNPQDLSYNLKVLKKEFIDTSWHITSYSAITSYITKGIAGEKADMSIYEGDLTKADDLVENLADNLSDIPALSQQNSQPQTLEQPQNQTIKQDLIRDKNIKADLDKSDNADKLNNLNNLALLSEDNVYNRHTFPRGANPGTFLHAVMEHLSFKDAINPEQNQNDLVEEVVAKEMQNNQIGRLWQYELPANTKSSNQLNQEHSNVPFNSVCSWIKNVIKTPLLIKEEGIKKPCEQNSTQASTQISNQLSSKPTPQTMPITLSSISDDKCLKELEFLIAISDIEAQKLNQIVENYYKKKDLSMYNLVLNRKVSFTKMQGFITGFIDLIIYANGKFYVLDYKSNYLGANITDYHTKKLREAIAEHRYDLQYIFYTIALTRFLKQRYGKNYSYAKLIGGVRYLFLRGMNGMSQSACNISQDTYKEDEVFGVFSTYIEEELIDEIEELLHSKI